VPRNCGDSKMKKSYFHSTVLPLVIIPFGGLLVLGICYLFYFLIYNIVEFLFFSTNPTSVPADMIRRAYALLLLVLYLVLLCTKISDTLKSTILVGPMGIVLTTTILAFYEKSAWAIAVTVVILAVSTFLLYRYKQPWIYYYAISITVLASVALAWPQA
jgi:hypothetical protein